MSCEFCEQLEAYLEYAIRAKHRGLGHLSEKGLKIKMQYAMKQLARKLADETTFNSIF